MIHFILVAIIIIIIIISIINTNNNYKCELTPGIIATLTDSETDFNLPLKISRGVIRKHQVDPADYRIRLNFVHIPKGLY